MRNIAYCIKCYLRFLAILNTIFIRICEISNYTINIDLTHISVRIKFGHKQDTVKRIPKFYPMYIKMERFGAIYLKF